MATEDDVRIIMKQGVPLEAIPEGPTAFGTGAVTFAPPISMDFMSEQDTIQKRYEMNEFNDVAQSSLLRMNEKGDTESMVKPILEGQEPVMQKYDDLGAEMNPTIGMIMEHFIDLGTKVAEDPTLAGQAKRTLSLPGQAIEGAVRNSLKFFAENILPEDVQNKFYNMGKDMEELDLVEKEGQPLGGPVGVLGSSKEFRDRQFFSPEENAWWEDLGTAFGQFAVGLKSVQMIANTKKLLVPSMAADGLVFDPEHGGLFTGLQALNLEPGAMQDVIDFMDSSKHDPNMGRAIQVAEGLLIGGLLGAGQIGYKNREQIKQFIKKIFMPGSIGRKAADPAIKKIAEIMTEVKSKWPHANRTFERYANQNGWVGPSYARSFYSYVKAVRTQPGELVFPGVGEITPKGFVKIRTQDGKEEFIDDHKWQPDPAQPHFGLPPRPKTLPDGHPLLTPTHTIKTRAREKIRNKIVKDAIKGIKTVDDRQPVAYLKAGGPGSGKASVDELLRKEGLVQPGVIEINADTYKTQLPEYQKFIDAGDSRGAGILHQESADLVNRVRDEVIKKNADVVFDGTLGNPKKAKALIKKLQAAGYEINLVGVTIDPEEAVTRSISRYAQTKRWVDIDMLLQKHRRVSKNWEKYVDLVDDVSLYDNNSKEPLEILYKREGEVVIADEKSYNEFIKKGNINEKADTLQEILPQNTDSARTANDGSLPRGDEGRGPMGDGQTSRSGSEGPQDTPSLADVTSSPEINQAKEKVNSIIADIWELSDEIQASGGRKGSGSIPIQEQELFVKEQERLHGEYDKAVKELEDLGGTPSITLAPRTKLLAGGLAMPAVYNPNEEYEVQQAGYAGGISKAMGKLFKSDAPDGRTVAPDQPRPSYGEPSIPIRELLPEDIPLPLDPDTVAFINKMGNVAEKDLYGKHSRVNFDMIESNDQFNDDFRRFLVNALELKDAVPESVTFDEIIAQAEKLHWGQKEVMNLDPKAWDQSAPMLKVRDVWLQAAVYAHKITKLTAEGDPQAAAKIGMVLQNLAVVTKQRNSLMASIARTLTAQKIKAGGKLQPGDPTLEQIDNIENWANTALEEGAEIPPGFTKQQFAKALMVAGDDASPDAWGKLAEDTIGWQEVFFAHMYPFMLSSFRTHAANWMSNGMVMTDYLGTQGFAAMVSPVRRKVLPKIPLLNRIFKDTGDRKSAREFLHALQIVRRTIPEAFHVGWKSYKMQPEKIAMGKMERKKMASEIVNAPTMKEMFQNINDPNNPHMKGKWLQKFITPRDLKLGGTMARAIDWWGKKLDYPGKLLHGADEFAKEFSRGVGEMDYSYRKAMKYVEEGIIAPDEVEEVVTNLLKERSPRMQSAGETLAEFQTFQNELGKIGKWIQDGREKVASWGWGIPWAHMVLAFVKTPINVQKYNLHLMNMTDKSRNDIMGNNGGAAQDEALGRWGVASLYVTSASGLATKFFSDNVWLNGYGSMGAEIATEGKESQRAKRMVEMNAGIKPCSIGIRDSKGTVHSYSFNTLEPISTYWCATADLANNWHDIVGHAGEGEAMKVVASLYEIMANNLINKNFARNSHEFMTILFDPNQALRSPKVADNLVSMVIPRIIKDMKTSLGTDDRYREFEHSMDGFSGMWDVMKNNIPGLSQTLGPKVNFWNEPIHNYGSWGPDFLSPFRYSKTTPDAVDNEMYRLLMPMRDLPRKLEKVKMHPRVRLQWYYLMNNHEGRGHGGMKMKQAIETLINPKNYRYHERMDEKYPGQPGKADEERIQLIKEILTQYKGEARKKLLDIANPDPIVIKYQPDLYERIQRLKEQDKVVQEQLDKDEMQTKTPRGWQDYYKETQQQPPRFN